MSERHTFATLKSQFVEVALPLPVRRLFTYRLRDEFAEVIKLGARVRVPFGRRILTGYTVALHQSKPAEVLLDDAAIKNVRELLDEEPLVTEEILRLTKWTADYYAASWGEILKASLPAGINAATEQIIKITESGRNALLKVANFRPLKWQILHDLSSAAEKSRAYFEREYGIAAVGRALRGLRTDGLVEIYDRDVATTAKAKFRKSVRLMDRTDKASVNLNLAQTAVITALSQAAGEMLFSELSSAAGSSASAINTLAKKGIVEVYMREVRRDPLLDAVLPKIEPITLNDDQAQVLAEIETSVLASQFRAFLLHGITGSGKTEVYIRSMKKTLEHGRSALMLVPEIALTPVFAKRLRAIFADEVAILHSNLSPGERFDEWRRVRSGDARIAIGTRSAIFAPLGDIGLIIVDEEHDTSYRQQESPYYNARDAAVMRASLNDATVVLGSATPALETFYNSRIGKYKYLKLGSRIGNRPLASAEIIDMRDVFKQAGKDVPLSPRLIAEIEATSRRGEQSIILQNRRGFSTFVLCRSCGQSLRCKNCDITLTYHRRASKIVCHYCGYNERVPHACTICSSEFLYFVGEGTEQIEEILRKRFPQLRIARIDRDTMARRGAMSRILTAFDRGDLDMLVGTQMLAKGHDFHNVTLVGVISVDIGLGLPDFRSAERTFQLLTQVAGRAGRGGLPGRVLIQTYYPEHYALKFACEQNFEKFFAAEMKFRRRLNYPPFVVLASILIKHVDYSIADKNARIFRAALDSANETRACQVLGPAPASISRLKNEFRLQILVKSTSRKHLRECLDNAVAAAESKGADLRCIHIEIDPVNLL